MTTQSIDHLRGTVLLFEGAGTKHHNRVNCRIRTRTTDSKGRPVYIELHGVEQSKHLIEDMRKTGYAIVGSVMHVLILDYDNPSAKPQDYPRAHLPSFFDYTEEGIVRFVNAMLGTKFSSFGYSSLRVHDTTDCLC